MESQPEEAIVLSPASSSFLFHLQLTGPLWTPCSCWKEAELLFASNNQYQKDFHKIGRKGRRQFRSGYTLSRSFHKPGNYLLNATRRREREAIGRSVAVAEEQQSGGPEATQERGSLTLHSICWVNLLQKIWYLLGGNLLEWEEGKTVSLACTLAG